MRLRSFSSRRDALTISAVDGINWRFQRFVFRESRGIEQIFELGRLKQSRKERDGGAVICLEILDPMHRPVIVGRNL